MTIRVLMYPHLDDIQPLPSNGISRVVKEYFKHLPSYGIEMLPKGAEDKADLIAIHAGARSVNGLPTGVPMVACCHGLYWTQDHPNMGVWTHEMNGAVIDVVRHASAIMVPSNWVADVLKRDMHLSPVVIGHGINWEEWQDDTKDNGYILWGKNRPSDACSPEAVNRLSERAPTVKFLTTYSDPNPRPNIKVTGTVDFETMKKMIKEASVYLSSVKDTWGIQIVEAMAAGKPVLGFAHGGNNDLVVHGFSGYLAQPGNYDDLYQGLLYCLEHREILGRNARKAARHYTWEWAAQQVASLFRETVSAYRDKYDRPMRIDRALYQKGNVI